MQLINSKNHRSMEMAMTRGEKWMGCDCGTQGVGGPVVSVVTGFAAGTEML